MLMQSRGVFAGAIVLKECNFSAHAMTLMRRNIDDVETQCFLRGVGKFGVNEVATGRLGKVTWARIQEGGAPV